MERKKQILNFLNENYCMINSLLSKEEKKTFNGDVVFIIKREIEKQVKEESED